MTGCRRFTTPEELKERIVTAISTSFWKEAADSFPAPVRERCMPYFEAA